MLSINHPKLLYQLQTAEWCKILCVVFSISGGHLAFPQSFFDIFMIRNLQSHTKIECKTLTGTHNLILRDKEFLIPE